MTLNFGKWRELWSALPDHGWPVSAAMRFLKDPPKWFVVCSGVFGLFVVTRAVYLIGFGTAEEVNKFIVGVAAFAGAPFLIWRTWIADRQRHIAQEELYTSLLTKAVEQLGTTREEKSYYQPPSGWEKDAVLTAADLKLDASNVISLAKTIPNIELRLGAIYALEKLAHDYLPLHWQIMEILCAYVRENAGKPRPCSSEVAAIYAKLHSEISDQEKALLEERRIQMPPRVDVQAALTVVGRRSEKQRDFEQKYAGADGLWSQRKLDLTACHLPRVNLAKLHFENANFFESYLEGALFEDSYLKNARFWRAHLEGAGLVEADLENVDFREAHLHGTWLLGSRVHGADFYDAEGLTQEQLDCIDGNKTTCIPKGFIRPPHWIVSDTG